jgi:hypothetical protein
MPPTYISRTAPHGAARMEVTMPKTPPTARMALHALARAVENALGAISETQALHAANAIRALHAPEKLVNTARIPRSGRTLSGIRGLDLAGVGTPATLTTPVGAFGLEASCFWTDEFLLATWLVFMSESGTPILSALIWISGPGWLRRGISCVQQPGTEGELARIELTSAIRTAKLKSLEQLAGYSLRFLEARRQRERGEGTRKTHGPQPPFETLIVGGNDVDD